MAPAIFTTLLRSSLGARKTAKSEISSLGPLTAHTLLTARDDTQTLDPSHGVTFPGDINNTAIFVLFGLLGVAFVAIGIWFFFWAKNGGFYFRKNDWDDYKSTVLRRRGPNGTLLSGATPSTQLGGGSVYKDIDDGSTEDASTVVSGTTALTGITAGVSDIAGREKRRKKREQKERERERRREEKEHDKEERKRIKKGARKVGPDGALIDEEAEETAKAKLREYRHEKPARVGGLNKESEGSAWDGSTNPSQSTAAPTDASGSTVTSELMSHRERTPTSTPTKRDAAGTPSSSPTKASGGIRKVYSTADKTATRENERIRAEARRLQERGRAAQGRDFSFQRADDQSQLRRVDERGTEASGTIPGSWTETGSETGTGSEVGPKSYQHSVHIPGTSSNDFAYAEEKRKRRGGAGYRRGQE